MISIIFLQTLILLIWFKTDAFIEYAYTIIPFDLFKIYPYYEAKANDVTLTYHQYLLYYHNCFFVKLITCPICLNVWLSIISCIILLNVISIPIVCVVSLLIYYLLCKLM